MAQTPQVNTIDIKTACEKALSKVELEKNKTWFSLKKLANLSLEKRYINYLYKAAKFSEKRGFNSLSLSANDIELIGEFL